MPNLMRITGQDKLRAQIKRMGTAKRSYRATVGFEAPYAIYVHENMECNHPNGGQAKFLEQPGRMYMKEMSRIIKNVSRQRGKTLRDAVKAAADFWLSKSLALTPVDTGFLYLSGYSTVSNYELSPVNSKGRAR